MASVERGCSRGPGAITITVVVALALAVAATGCRGTRRASSPTTLAPTPARLTPVAAAGLNAVNPPPLSATCSTPAPPPSGPAPTGSPAANPGPRPPAPASVPFPALDGSSPHYTAFSAAPPFCIDVSNLYTATMVTDVGTVTIQLLPANAPVTVNNLVFLAGYHYFDGMTLQRVTPGPVDPNGDATVTASGGPGYQIPDELPKSADAYDVGAVAMANRGPNTNGGQFFLVTGPGGPPAGRPPAYSMFGQIVNGINVADRLNTTTAHKILAVDIFESRPPAPPATTGPPTTPPPTTAPATTVPATNAPATTAPGTTTPDTAGPDTTAPAIGTTTPTAPSTTAGRSSP